MTKVILFLALSSSLLLSGASAHLKADQFASSQSASSQPTSGRSLPLEARTRDRRTADRTPRWNDLRPPRFNYSDVTGVVTTCNYGFCTVSVNGTNYGPYAGSSVSVSSSSVNGVSSTEIYVDGQLVEQF